MKPQHKNMHKKPCKKSKRLLDVDPRRDDDASPMSSYIGACWDLLEWFHLFGTSQNISKKKLKKKTSQTKYKSKFNLDFF